MSAAIVCLLTILKTKSILMERTYDFIIAIDTTFMQILIPVRAEITGKLKAIIGMNQAKLLLTYYQTFKGAPRNPLIGLF